MVKSSNKSIGLLGGSFDPAHKGHFEISKIAIRIIKLDKVLWLVTKKNPFKKKPFYSLQQRLYRAKKIASKERKIKVVHIDKIVNSSRSINLITYLINTKGFRNIYFIIGTDNLIRFHKWKSWKKIVKLTKLVVFSRKGYDRKGYNSTVSKYLKNKIIYIRNKTIEISSSKLRKQLKKNN